MKRVEVTVHRLPLLFVTVTLAVVLVALLLLACQVPPIFPTPVPTNTPTATPTLTPTPTPTPSFLTLVTASFLPPTSTQGAILFSTEGTGEGVGNEPVLWHLATEGFAPLTGELLPGRWDCNETGAQTCVFADQQGQVYTTTAISLAAPLLISPTLPITRIDLSPSGGRLAIMFTETLDILDLQVPGPLLAIDGLRDLAELAWAPDNQHLAYVTRTATMAALYVLDVTGDSGPKQVADGDWIGAVSWAPDSKQLAFAQRGLDHPNGGNQRQDLFVTDMGGVEVVNRTEYFEDRERPPPGHAFGARWSGWQPDGRAVGFTWTSWTSPPDQVEVDVVAPEAGGGLPDLVLTEAGVLAADGTRLLWSPDGSQVAALIARVGEPASRLLWLRPISATTWLPVTPPEHVVTDVCWTGDSRVLVYTTEAGGLYWADANGGTPVQLVQAKVPQAMTGLRCPPQP